MDGKNDSSYLGSGVNLKKAIKKYGRKNFNKEILYKDSDKENLKFVEKFYIKKFKSQDSLIGYNIADGGDGGNRKGLKLSKTTKEKISQAKKGIKWGNHSEETKLKLSNSHKGIKFSDEHKKHLSEKRKLRITSEETRAKASNTSRGVINIKKYILISPEGIVYKTPNGLTDFCRHKDLTRANLIAVVKGRRKHHKGWTIKYDN